MKIYAPSFKRAKGLKTHKLIPDVIYVVAEFEAEEYKAEGVNVHVIPDKVQGNIARVRNYIKNELIKDEKAVIIDDDIEGLKHHEWNGNRFSPETVTDLMEFFEMGFVLAEESDCKLWGVNIVGDKGSYREYTPISYTNWISGSLMGFNKCDCEFDERIPLKEDIDFSVQVINKYRKLLRLNAYHLIKKDHGNRGGCADYRTIEREKEQLGIFQRKWGKGIVKNDLTQRGTKQKGYDIDPVIKLPIKGV